MSKLVSWTSMMIPARSLCCFQVISTQFPALNYSFFYSFSFSAPSPIPFGLGLSTRTSSSAVLLFFPIPFSLLQPIDSSICMPKFSTGLQEQFSSLGSSANSACLSCRGISFKYLITKIFKFLTIFKKQMIDQMSSEHQEYFRKVFHQFDIDGDNTMSRQEVCLLMGALGQNLSQTKIDQLINEIDTDGNGIIDCEQFLHLMHIIMKKPDTSTEFRSIFKIFDRDGNGSISSGELNQVMINLERPLTTSQLQEIYRKVNQNGKEEIDQDQFVRLLMRKES